MCSTGRAVRRSRRRSYDNVFATSSPRTSVSIPAASVALAVPDVAAFADAANRSQAEGVRLLGNQIAETEALAQLALQRGAVAASAFGAGFGGSVWALTAEDEIEAFLAGWSADYLGRFPQYEAAARFFQTRPGPAVAAL